MENGNRTCEMERGQRRRGSVASRLANYQSPASRATYKVQPGKQIAVAGVTRLSLSEQDSSAFQLEDALHRGKGGPSDIVREETLDSALIETANPSSSTGSATVGLWSGKGETPCGHKMLGPNDVRQSTCCDRECYTARFAADPQSGILSLSAVAGYILCIEPKTFNCHHVSWQTNHTWKGSCQLQSNSPP